MWTFQYGTIASTSGGTFTTLGSLFMQYTTVQMSAGSTFNVSGLFYAQNYSPLNQLIGALSALLLLAISHVFEQALDSCCGARLQCSTRPAPTAST